ncbi:hypothetical protein [Rhizobium mesoamericanum]|uniref:Uncharacterized protein n=1 Tax=Rhizobium mesoamericanum STM3625 TaxID=1211777 RepID=K0PX47_9HYPH|nr:hypothetical protein [Rhizobium mesoamericanum]CCM75927.1 hypothetical protein BN77_3113 [Rhizobium mesoamericanum STM3625]
MYSSDQLRYDVICDPLDQWMVWDNQTEEPAFFGGQILYGLTESHAVELAKIMNELYGNEKRDTARSSSGDLGPTACRSAGG